MKIPEYIPQLKHVNSGNFFLIAGPCVIESKDLCFEVAEKIIAMADRLESPYIFKSSYKKANRSKLDSLQA